MNRARKLAPRLATAVALSFAACATPLPTTGYTPVTGVRILASDITAGHGCGTSLDQVYRYAALVEEDVGMVHMSWSGVFECFSDGPFSNLPSVDSGAQLFHVSVYAYNRASFPAALDCPPDAAKCPGDNPATLQPLEASANWMTTCTVTQVQGVSTVAVCSANQGSTSSDAAVAE